MTFFNLRHAMLLHRLRPILIFAVGAVLILLPPGAGLAADKNLHHELEVEIFPDTQILRGVDTIRVSHGISHLHVAMRPGVRILGVKGARYTYQEGRLRLVLEKSHSPSGTVVLRYEGVFDDPFEAEPFSMDNPGQGVVGTITDDAAFFLAGSGWYPVILDDVTETLRVSVTAPKGIYAVMEGKLEAHRDSTDKSRSIWSVPRPSGPLALFAGRYIINERRHGSVRIATYFLAANAGLADRYLTATQRHIRRYEALFGPYPFAKFAVVENFFPTGYGFPSFTLLGSRVLQLPFIPVTSLRHEVAHCWWGNGVFVDVAEGNWCEGLTTYVADYLAKEEQSAQEARDYRRRTLEKYALLAAGEQDFPLSTFRSRYSPASQAVGYGKAMFVFHMMRQRIGEDAFWTALREVYAQRLFKRSGWNHFMDAFARHGSLGRDEVRRFHEQWIARPGALQLALDRSGMSAGPGTWKVTGVLTQKPSRFNASVPVVVAGETMTNRQSVHIDGATQPFAIPLAETPRTVSVDPDFDLFRRLYPEEIPATVSAVKGSTHLVAVLADGTPKSWGEIFRGLLVGLNHGDAMIWSERRFAAEKPAGKDVLFFGMPKQTTVRALLSELGEAVELSSAAFQVGENISSHKADTLFAVFKKNQRLVAVFLPVAGTDLQTVMRTARKITHYGRYGQLAFKGGVNAGKGVGAIHGSPLVVHLEEDS